MAAPLKVSLNLVGVTDKKGKKVVFAEAGKETVDFLCNILTLPVGMVIRLLSKQGMVGCLSNLYQSIESLNDDYIQPNQHKDTVLKSMAPITFRSNSLVHQFLTYVYQKEKLFRRCDYGHFYLSDTSLCPCCKTSMSYGVTVVNPDGAGEVAGIGSGSGGGGFVKGMVKYMVMDDLVVAPLFTNTQLNMFNVTDVGSLEEKVVDLDLDKALKLLEISLQSKNVLTTVFL